MYSWRLLQDESSDTAAVFLPKEAFEATAIFDVPLSTKIISVYQLTVTDKVTSEQVRKKVKITIDPIKKLAVDLLLTINNCANVIIQKLFSHDSIKLSIEYSQM